MPERECEFEILLSHIGDTLRVRFVREHGRTLRFTVQYETPIEDRFVPVVRYDTAHGFAHRDILDWDGSTRHSDPMSGNIDYAAAMDAAILDLESNWERYQFEFFRRRP